MYKVGKLNIEKALLLAPMEDVSNFAFRKLCIEFGADLVFTEFINSDGLIRNNEKTARKMQIADEERPVGIQIYGSDIPAMVKAAQMAAELNPDLIDINAGCWVKKVSRRGAGAGLLKDPPYMQEMVSAVVKAVEIPVTVKTRIGWDSDTIMITEVARRMEDAGAKSLTVHCRTRNQGHSGEADWDWIPKIKEVVDFPVVLNGGVFSAEDTKLAFDSTNADGVMIARGAIGAPWIFLQSKEILKYGEVKTEINHEIMIDAAIKHLRYEIELKDEERRAIIPFRKYWSGYLKGLYDASSVRREIMKIEEFEPLKELLLDYKEKLSEYYENRDEEL